MNTIIDYLYRDASNYKRWNTEIVSGEITQEDLDRIEAILFDGEYFVPHDVGLPEHRVVDDYRTDDDHCWFEWQTYDVDDVEFTSQPPTIDLTIDQLVSNFESVVKWDERGWMKCYPYKSYDEIDGFV